MSLQRCIRLVNFAFAVLFSANVSTASAQQKTPHRRPNSDRKHSERDIRCSAHGRCREVRLRHCTRLLHLRRGRPIHRGYRRGHDQSPACGGQTLRVERDGTDVHISGNTAWIAYVNQGSITDASGTVSQKWLESAFLQKQGGIWKIVFMHSTRVPVAPPESHGK